MTSCILDCPLLACNLAAARDITGVYYGYKHSCTFAFARLVQLGRIERCRWNNLMFRGCNPTTDVRSRHHCLNDIMDRPTAIKQARRTANQLSRSLERRGITVVKIGTSKFYTCTYCNVQRRSLRSIEGHDCNAGPQATVHEGGLCSLDSQIDNAMASQARVLLVVL